MNNISVISENMLCDVRKSFRLLYQYNQQVLDLVKYIGNQFGIDEIYGFPRWSTPAPAPVRNKATSIDNRLAWDWLNMHLYEFNFISEDDLHFSIVIQSDTGRYDGNTNWTNIESFGDVNKAQTRLIFVLGDKYWNLDFHGLFEDADIMYKNESTKIIKDPEDDGKMYVMAFPLTKFKDKETITAGLQEWVDFLHKHGIDKLKKK
ncbi:MAG: hypothetical protein FWE37_04960 [Spirochaetaceae bacterium]|nr:hypothetical protein [Spirochaetaceae bacterium]